MPRLKNKIGAHMVLERRLAVGRREMNRPSHCADRFERSPSHCHWHSQQAVGRCYFHSDHLPWIAFASSRNLIPRHWGFRHVVERDYESR